MKSAQRLSKILRNCAAETGYSNGHSLSRLFSTSPSHSFQKSLTNNLRVGVQGVELYRGQNKRGVELGPKAIRDTGVVAALRNVGHEIVDYGNAPIMEMQEEAVLQERLVASGGRQSQTVPESDYNGYLNVHYVKQVADANRMISDWTSKIMRDGRVCLTLGGDHALGIGTVNGASQVHPDLGVLWIDAHSDINTPLTTGSGKIHGMSVAFFVQELQPYMTQLPEFSWVQPRIKAANLAFIGLRDVDPAERAILEMLGITAYSMRDVDRHGIQKVTEMALSKISQDKKRPIHVSYDIDSLCESIVKSTGTPVPGGLSLREGITLLEMINETGRMVSMDLVEVNPLLGSELDAAATAQAAKHLILGAFGHSRGGMALNSIPKP
ncbi:Arginase-2, mitochondrial [Orchesella cincta]|uniref:Arginase n=1 Tax=Orchesella cincta TaxID=48709 RepID=A0A1D2MVY3_ORCCI|nr:Arginase-2, mitochondrial [Orchesella cincta]